MSTQDIADVKRPWVIGVDLGATKIALGLVNPDNQICAYRRIPTHAQEGPQDVVARISKIVRELEDEMLGYGQMAPGARIAALGICCPGPIDYERGMIVDPPNIPGLHYTPLRRMLAERLNVPVCLEHDAKAAALGEFYYGAGRGERSMVYIVLGTGVGAAIIIDGQLYRGTHNTAGELGHITLDRDGALCSCGSRGCVETYVSGPWLARRYERARDEARYKTSDQGERAGRMTGEWVAKRAREGDALAKQIITQAGEALGVAVASMAMILDIELYVIGSSVAKCGDLLLEPAHKAVPLYAYQSVASRVCITSTDLWDDGPILGCAWMARQICMPPNADRKPQRQGGA
jgi:glucokinase